MTPLEVFRALDTYLHVNWSDTSIHEEGYEFSATNDTAFIEPKLVLDEVMEGEVAGPSGDGVSLRYGTYLINVYAPLNVGTVTVWGYAGDLESLFYYKDINHVQTERPYSRNMGVEDGFFRVVVLVPIWAWVE